MIQCTSGWDIATLPGPKWCGWVVEALLRGDLRKENECSCYDAEKGGKECQFPELSVWALYVLATVLTAN